VHLADADGLRERGGYVVHSSSRFCGMTAFVEVSPLGVDTSSERSGQVPANQDRIDQHRVVVIGDFSDQLQTLGLADNIGKPDVPFQIPLQSTRRPVIVA